MAVEAFSLEVGSQDFAGACRRAYMQMLMGAHIGWTKVDLAQWLAGPYQQLTQPDDHEDSPASKGPTSITDDRLARLLDTMRIDILLVLHELATSHGLSALTTLAFDTRLVRRDEVTREVIPLSRPRMTLVDRVLSLVAVDALTRPFDFERAFFVCERCHLPAFDAQAREARVCRVHVSGVQHT